MAFLQGRLVDNLPKVYGIYTGGFILFIILMSILSSMGVSAATIGILFVAFTICIYAIIGWLSRTMQLDAYYVAGREVPAVYNGMATAADWMSGASFVALAGGVYFGGYIYMGFVVGWTGGYVLVNALMAPYLRKFGCYTVPDFIGTRYGGNLARLCAVIVLVVASFTYVTAQINASGTIAARALQIPFSVGIWVGLAAILMCSMLGGMRAVTWTQVAQYIVLIIAYLTPVIWMSNVAGLRHHPALLTTAAPSTAFRNCNPLVHLGDEGNRVVQGPPYPDDADQRDRRAVGKLEVLHARACMMAGTASLPHILMRYFTTPSVRAARKSVGWSLFFIFLLYFTAPCLATLTKLQFLDPNLPTSIIGKPFAAVADLAWIKNWSAVGMLKVSDSNHDGILQTQRVLHAARHRRAGNAGNGRSAIRHFGPRRRRRPGGGHVDRRRVAAGDRQRAQPRSLLQDDRSECGFPPASDRGANSSGHHRRGGVRNRIAPAHRHSRRGGLGILTSRAPASSSRSCSACGGSGPTVKARSRA